MNSKDLPPLHLEPAPPPSYRERAAYLSAATHGLVQALLSEVDALKEENAELKRLVRAQDEIMAPA